MRTEGSGKEDEKDNEKENATGRWNVPPIPPRPGTSAREMRGDDDAKSNREDGEEDIGYAPGYVRTPEYLPLREVYDD